MSTPKKKIGVTMTSELYQSLKAKCPSHLSFSQYTETVLRAALDNLESGVMEAQKLGYAHTLPDSAIAQASDYKPTPDDEPEWSDVTIEPCYE